MSVSDLIRRCHLGAREKARKRADDARTQSVAAAYAAIVQYLAVFAQSPDHRDPGVVVCKHNYPCVDVQKLMKRLAKQGFSTRIGALSEDHTNLNTAILGVGPECRDAARARESLGLSTSDSLYMDSMDCMTLVVCNTWAHDCPASQID
jgi:hypothetical protein